MKYRITALALLLAPVLMGSVRAQVTEYKIPAFQGGEQSGFGVSVALSGERAIVGTLWDDDRGVNSGAAFIFERQMDGSWQEVAKLTADDADARATFGLAVAISGERAIIGSGCDCPLDYGSSASYSAYVFERQADGSWTQAAELMPSGGSGRDNFGFSVAIADEYALVGAYGNNDLGINSGTAYIFERQEDGTWPQAARLTASDGAAEDYFGFSLALSGNRALVAAHGNDALGPNSGAAYVFERQEDGSWPQTAKLQAPVGSTDRLFGRSVSLSGEQALIGAQSTATSFVFERQEDGTWRETAHFTAAPPLTSVAQSENHAFIGTISGGGTGSAHLFERQEDDSWLEVTQFNATNGDDNDRYGWSVALSGDNALVSAYGESGFRGAFYVYSGLSSLSVATEANPGLPEQYQLSAVYPNPFNPQAQVSLTVAQAQQVRVEVYDALGHRVGMLHEGLLAGQTTHEFTFQAGSLPSGVYLLRVQGETFTDTRVMTLLK